MTEREPISPEMLKKLSREQLLDVTSWMIEDLRGRVAVDRFRVREGDETKLKFFRVMVSAIQVYASILKDEDLDDIRRRLTLLENTIGEKT
jgi:hypothetical protein